MLRFVMLVGVFFGPFAAMNAQTPDATVEMLQKLADAPGPPGAEEPVRALMYPVMKQNSSTISFDGLGSVIAQQGTTGPRVMVDAHMDELGGMVRRVTPSGFVTMQMLGRLAGPGAGRPTLEHLRQQGTCARRDRHPRYPRRSSRRANTGVLGVTA